MKTENNKKMKEMNIKKHYHDALYWATSTLSKDKDYHITRTQEAILRKLIHYSTSNEKITYSNRIIAEHTFIGEETLKKNIPKLDKIGFISTATHKITHKGEYKIRRTIIIKWSTLKEILLEVPNPDKEKEESSREEEPNSSHAEETSVDVEMDTISESSGNTEDLEISEPDKIIDLKELISVGLGEEKEDATDVLYDFLHIQESSSEMTPFQFMKTLHKHTEKLIDIDPNRISITEMMTNVNEAYLKEKKTMIL